jgi:cytochrome c
MQRMMKMAAPSARLASLLFALCLLLPNPAEAQLRGHGGPVRALAISADGKEALSGSFDTAAIRWSLARNAAEQVLRFHEGAVNAVAILPDGRLVTAGADTKIAIWKPGEPRPSQVLEGHEAPVVSVAISPDGTSIASASWDRTVRVWLLAGGAPRVLEGHQMNVNGVAFAPDGKSVVSAGYDATVRIWPLAGDASPTVVTLPSPLNAVSVTPKGEILVGGADGKVHFLSATGETLGEVEIGQSPVIAVGTSPDGKRAAAASSRQRSWGRACRSGRSLSPLTTARFIPAARTASFAAGTPRRASRSAPSP